MTTILIPTFFYRVLLKWWNVEQFNPPSKSLIFWSFPNKKFDQLKNVYFLVKICLNFLGQILFHFHAFSVQISANHVQKLFFEL